MLQIFRDIVQESSDSNLTNKLAENVRIVLLVVVIACIT